MNDLINNAESELNAECFLSASSYGVLLHIRFLKQFLLSKETGKTAV